MYPNLRYAFYDTFGIDIPALALIQSYGFFLAMAFFVSGMILTMDMKRRENLGIMQGVEETIMVGKPFSMPDAIVNGILGFLLGFKGLYALFNPDAFAGHDAQQVLVSLDHGSWIGGGLMAALFIGWKYWERKKEVEKYPQQQEIRKMVLPHERVTDIVVISAISGILGAKILYLIGEPQEFFDDPIGAIFSGSGLTIYGGLIFAFFVVTSYARRKKIQVAQLIDATAPALILAYGIGRLGCHFSGDGDWGDPNPATRPGWLSWMPDWMWAYKYPNNVLHEASDNPLPDCGGYPEDFGNYCNELSEAVYPTPVWEFMMCFVIFIILWKLRVHIKVHGLLFCIYLIFNGVERFSIEAIRVNIDYKFLGITLTQAQAIAIVLFLIGCIGTFILGRRQLQLKNIPELVVEKPEDSTDEIGSSEDPKPE